MQEAEQLDRPSLLANKDKNIDQIIFCPFITNLSTQHWQVKYIVQSHWGILKQNTVLNKFRILHKLFSEGQLCPHSPVLRALPKKGGKF